MDHFSKIKEKITKYLQFILKKELNFIYEINYEKLIKYPKIEITKLIKFCDLDWNDDCLNFHKNSRVIKTASDTQARKKIYKSSVNSWLNYRKYIKNFNNN